MLETDTSVSFLAAKGRPYGQFASQIILKDEIIL